MKKHALMWALVVSLVLAFSAVARADADQWYRIKSFNVPDGVFEAEAGKEVTVEFEIVVEVIGQETDGYYKNANLLQWTVGGATMTTESEIFKITAVTVTNNGNSNTSKENVSEYVITSTSTVSGTSTADCTLHIKVTGNLKDSEGDLQVVASLWQKSSGSAAFTTSESSTTSGAAKLDASKAESDSIVVTEQNSDPSNPDSLKWDGIDPIISQDINTASYDIGKNKPKLGKVDKNDLTFPSGTPKNITIPMTGPITELDVYIAAKDAMKLWPSSFDKKSNSLQLTKANIKEYKIPFRITAKSLASTVTGSTAKEQQKAWKSAANSLIITYNGAKVEYKGYPITISMKNSNTQKAVAKAIKVNVTPNTTIPAWTYEEYEDDVKTETESQELKTDGSHTTKDAAVASLDVQYATLAEQLASKHSNHNFKISSGEISTAEDSGKYTVSVDVSYSYTDGDYVTKSVDKKGVELVSAVLPDQKKAYAFEGEYEVSLDSGPYVITVKPDPTKDAAKINKFMSNWSIDITQPTFNYLGNIEKPGSVFIKGTPVTTEKESKLAFTLTATNPSTKKKGAAKVTAFGKTLPVIQKTDTVSTDVEKYKVLQGYKPVEAGKLPKASVKAKGSKVISYKLGVWYLNHSSGNLEETESVSDYYYDEDTDTETLIENYEDDEREVLSEKGYAALLAKHKLSFDAKKGAIVLLNKTDKATTATVDEDGENFESMDIWVTAYNNVGVDHVQAWIGITGAKPKVSDKNVTFSGTVKSEDLKTFKVMAGKTAAESITDGSANVKVYPADGVANTLAKYGLALVTYNGITKTLDSTDCYAAGTEITETKWNEISGDRVSGTVSQDMGTKAYIASDDVYVSNGKQYVDNEYEDASKKNYGILEVTDPAALVAAAAANTDKINKGVKINLTLDNLGAIQKGTITIIADSKLVNGSAPVSASATTSASASARDIVTVNAKNGSGGSASTSAPEGSETESEAEETTEVTLTKGEARTAADLTAAQQAFLAANGYKVIAVLPELKATADGQQDIDDIVLDEDAPEGEEMIYIPFPKDAEESEDDNIVDFYDEAGAPVEGVPASHKIIASPWLRENVTYAPVIAIEAE